MLESHFCSRTSCTRSRRRTYVEQDMAEGEYAASVPIRRLRHASCPAPQPALLPSSSLQPRVSGSVASTALQITETSALQRVAKARHGDQTSIGAARPKSASVGRGRRGAIDKSLDRPSTGPVRPGFCGPPWIGAGHLLYPPSPRSLRRVAPFGKQTNDDDDARHGTSNDVEVQCCADPPGMHMIPWQHPLRELRALRHRRGHDRVK